MKIWLGSYLIEKCHENGVVQIKTVDEEGIHLLVNSYWVRLYRKPMSEVEFINTISKEVNGIGSTIDPSPQHS